MRTRNTGASTQDQIVRDFIRLRDNDTCQICGRRYNMWYAVFLPHMFFDSIELDHIIPFSHGGRNSSENYQLTCRECNRKKGSKLVLDKSE
jgi:5-methylcytosine-specific restriction endonuclease McrA